MTALYICLGTLAFLLIIILAASAVTYKMAFYRNPKKHVSNPYSNIDKGAYAKYSDISRALIDNVLTIPFENVYITSADGLRLRGRLYIVSEDAHFIIQFHGYKSTPMKDFSGAGVMSLDFGYNVIMVDQRAHGESDGRTICFGGKEKYDCLCWINYVKERFGEDRRIILQGISMGAATVLLCSAEKLPDSVVGIMADCPYSSAEKILCKHIREMGLPPKIFYPLLRLGAIIFGRFDPSKVDVTAAVAKAKVPILLVHGAADTFVPCYMSEEIAKTGKTDFHRFHDAEHGISYLIDTDRYKSLALNFMNRLLGE